MPSNPELYIPQTLGEVDDRLGAMMLNSPLFKRHSRYLPESSLDTEFLALNEGLKRIHSDLGEELYERLARMSDQMRALFEADPEDKTGETAAGQKMILQMIDLIQARAKEIGWTAESGPGYPWRD
jgi:hypothetical protein